MAGRRTRITHPDSKHWDYDYLVTGELSAVRENGATSGVGVLATYTYDTSSNAGQLGIATGITFGNGASTSYAYDAVQRLSSLGHDTSGTSYDQTLGFSYNPANQITQNTRSNDIYAWNGHYNVNRSYTANGLNQYTASGSVTPTYDSKGNLTSAGSTTYSYSSENLLKTASGGITLSYDPAMRLYETAGGSPGTTRRQYDGVHLVAEYNGSGTVLRRYVHGAGTDAPIVWYEGSGLTTRRFLQADDGGSVTAVSDGSAAIVGTNAYDEYGIPASTNLGRFQYTGQTWLPELGMYYYKARVYSPTLGRFLQPDPIGYGDGMNSYAYVGSDPTNATDPTGTVVEIKRSGNNISLTFRIAYYGPNATAARQKFNNGIASAWTGTFGKYHVTTTVISTTLSAAPTRSIIWNNISWNFVEIISGSGTSEVANSRFGYWYSNDKGHVAAHEAGHLAWLRDKYDRKTKVPYEGYEEAIMGAYGKPVTERTITDLLNANGLASGKAPPRQNSYLFTYADYIIRSWKERFGPGGAFGLVTYLLHCVVGEVDLCTEPTTGIPSSPREVPSE